MVWVFHFVETENAIKLKIQNITIIIIIIIITTII